MDAGIGHRDDHAFSLADAMRLGNFKVTEVPLVGAHLLFGVGRWLDRTLQVSWP
ncbi:hypothetical protein ACFFMR_01420 [Micromonospora andamanensis]|uniref:hypothetical protein n=1 Tax=Micromonospora andamanensis TaxID=1287068 RepID=UPI001EF19E56|nr:hypothetical protein [Micromonospora andamanensis]